MEENRPIYCSIKDTVEITGLSEYFLRNLLKDGQLPHIRSGAKIYVNVPKLAALLEGGE